MKYFILLALMCFTMQVPVFADGTDILHTMSDVTVFNEKGKWGLKDTYGNSITEAEYQKMIRIGDYSWLIQKRNKFGLIDCDGNILIKPKYRHTERILQKYVKFGNDNDFGIYDEYGKIIIEPIYTKIDILYGGMFLTYRNYKYGVVDFNGNILLDNQFDEIYMPQPNVIVMEYDGKKYEIEQVTKETLTLPSSIGSLTKNKNFKVNELIANPLPATGYSVVTATDYFIKLFSSISPAYEETIDELMLSRGADTVSIFTKATWIPKFPFTYMKRYYINVRTPNNGPLSDVKKKLKNNI